MRLFFTFYTKSGEDSIERISTSAPENINLDNEIVYTFDWDEVSDIPIDPAGYVYEGVIIESNYKEDGVVRMRQTGEIKIYCNGELIPMPDDYERFENTYIGGNLVDSKRIEWK